MPTSVQTIETLEQALANIDRFKTTAYVLQNDVVKEAQLTSDQRGGHIRVYWLETPGRVPFKHIGCDNLSAAFSQLSIWFNDAVIYSHSVIIEEQTDDKLYNCVQQAWCECITNAPQEDFGTTTPHNFRNALLMAKLLPLLTGGPSGIQKWNQQLQTARNVNWDQCQLSGKVLKQADLYNLQFNSSNFDGANLDQAILSLTRLYGATFCGAKMNKAQLIRVEANGAKFTGASMKQCKMEHARLNHCDFTDADLTKADMRNSALQGADLSMAKLTGTRMEGAEYDERTKLPQPLEQWPSLYWTGSDPDPFKKSVRDAFERDGCKTFDEFKTHVSMNFDGARLTNAFKMLKKERFQLFTQVQKTHLLGVVKSQTNPDLVYSCSLTSDGDFYCGTQNLKPCGGLSGALCKHILVLIIGLARSDQINLTDATKWIIASTDKKPAMNKPMMTEVFLKYKGAEAGEVDWRPTETIPEDYYAY